MVAICITERGEAGRFGGCSFTITIRGDMATSSIVDGGVGISISCSGTICDTITGDSVQLFLETRFIGVVSCFSLTAPGLVRNGADVLAFSLDRVTALPHAAGMFVVGDNWVVFGLLDCCCDISRV